MRLFEVKYWYPTLLGGVISVQEATELILIPDNEYADSHTLKHYISQYGNIMGVMSTMNDSTDDASTTKHYEIMADIHITKFAEKAIPVTPIISEMLSTIEGIKNNLRDQDYMLLLETLSKMRR